MGFFLRPSLVGEMFPAAESLEQIGEGAKETAAKTAASEDSGINRPLSQDVSYEPFELMPDAIRH